MALLTLFVLLHVLDFGFLLRCEHRGDFAWQTRLTMISPILRELASWPQASLLTRYL